jgi:hypothetical protein
MAELPALVAHQGGWDELLFVLLPIALFGVLLAVANRRASRIEGEQDAEADDDR